MNTKKKWFWPTLLACVLPLAGCDMLATKYHATVWLRVAKSRPSIFPGEKKESDVTNDRDAQPALMRSRLVLEVAIKRPGIAELTCLKNEETDDDKINWLMKNLEAGYLGSSEILQISITGRDPDELMKIVDAVRQAYMEAVVAKGRELDAQRLATLEQACTKTEEMFNKMVAEYQELSNKLGVADPQAARYANIYALETVGTLRNQANVQRTKISGLERRMAILKGRMSLLPEEERSPRKERMQQTIHNLTQKALDDDPDIAELRAELARLDKDLSQQQQQVENPDETPEVVALRDQIRDIQQIITGLTMKRIPEIEKKAAEQMKDLPPNPEDAMREEIDHAEIDRQVFEAELDTINEAFQQAVASAKAFAEGAKKMETLQEEINRIRKMHQQMAVTRDEWMIESMAAQRVQIVGEPMVTKMK